MANAIKIQSIMKQTSSRLNICHRHLPSFLFVADIIPSNQYSQKLQYHSSSNICASSHDKIDSSATTEKTDRNTSLKASLNWKKNQLDTISNKFKNDGDIIVIDNDDDLQSMWKAMESRVTKRKLPPKSGVQGVKSGRKNIRKSEEDEWLNAGLYDEK